MKRTLTERQLKRLHEAIAPYIDIAALRQLVADGGDLRQALSTDAPDDVLDLIEAIAALLTPRRSEQIKSPADIAALLMVSMGHLDQEELRVICLDTKNRIIGTTILYRGNVSSAIVRVGEIFKEAIRLNAPSIIIAHCHPSGNVDASPDDIAITRQIVAGSKLLDIELLDHLIIGQGKWISMRERRIIAD